MRPAPLDPLVALTDSPVVLLGVSGGIAGGKSTLARAQIQPPGPAKSASPSPGATSRSGELSEMKARVVYSRSAMTCIGRSPASFASRCYAMGDVS